MKISTLFTTAAILIFGTIGSYAGDWISLFDGKTLDGWLGNTDFWSVEDGTITGATTVENPIAHSIYLVSKKSYDDFEIKFKYRIFGGNSGLQYRSRIVDEETLDLHGYQADLEAGPTYSGILYETGGREIMVTRGKKVEATADGTLKELAELGDADEIQAKIHTDDWNEYHIIAKGNHLIHRINGVVTAELIDNQEDRRVLSGIFGFQLHEGPPMKVQFKDVVIRKL